MAQVLFSGGSSGTVANLDANFTELYGYSKNLVSDASGNVAIGTAKWFGASAGASYTADDGTFGGAINNGGGFRIYTAAVERVRWDASGNRVDMLQATPPTLATNSQMVMNLTSNTNLRISVRGSDGTTRVANITLA